MIFPILFKIVFHAVHKICVEFNSIIIPSEQFEEISEFVRLVGFLESCYEVFKISLYDANDWRKYEECDHEN